MPTPMRAEKGAAVKVSSRSTKRADPSHSRPPPLWAPSGREQNLITGAHRTHGPSWLTAGGLTLPGPSASGLHTGRGAPLICSSRFCPPNAASKFPRTQVLFSTTWASRHHLPWCTGKGSGPAAYLLSHTTLHGSRTALCLGFPSVKQGCSPAESRCENGEQPHRALGPHSDPQCRARPTTPLPFLKGTPGSHSSPGAELFPQPPGNQALISYNKTTSHQKALRKTSPNPYTRLRSVLQFGTKVQLNLIK